MFLCLNGIFCLNAGRHKAQITVRMSRYSASLMIINGARTVMYKTLIVLCVGQFNLSLLFSTEILTTGTLYHQRIAWIVQHYYSRILAHSLVFVFLFAHYIKMSYLIDVHYFFYRSRVQYIRQQILIHSSDFVNIVLLPHLLLLYSISATRVAMYNIRE